MAAILNFRIFAKNGKTQIRFYLLNHARWSNFVENFDPEGIKGMYLINILLAVLKKISSHQNWRPF